jgi:hypothetical protein
VLIQTFAGWPTAVHPLMLAVALVVALGVGIGFGSIRLARGRSRPGGGAARREVGVSLEFAHRRPDPGPRGAIESSATPKEARDANALCWRCRPLSSRSRRAAATATPRHARADAAGNDRGPDARLRRENDLLADRGRFELSPWPHGQHRQGLTSTPRTRSAAAEHGGTHLDAPIHFSEKARAADAIPIEQLIGVGIRVDVSDKCAKNRDYA